MENKLVREINVPLSQSDNQGLMSTPGAFALFMDMASEHAGYIGMGMDTILEKGLIWLVSKTKLVIHRRPAMFSKVTVTTWPGEGVKARSNRYYKMEQDGQLIMEAKNEWAIYHLETAKLKRMEEIYPPELEILPDVVCDVPYLKLKDNFDDCEESSTYTVLSTDLDTSQHMNNVNYIKVVFGMFSSAQLAEMDIAEVDISYKNQCYEGELLTLKKKNVENGFEIGIFKEDGTRGALAKIAFR